MGGDEGVLDKVEGGGLVAEEILGVGEERELVTGEQGAPRRGVTGAGGGDVGGECGQGVGSGDGAGHPGRRKRERGAWSGMAERAKGSTRARFSFRRVFRGSAGPGRDGRWGAAWIAATLGAGTYPSPPLEAGVTTRRRKRLSPGARSLMST